MRALVSLRTVLGNAGVELLETTLSVPDVHQQLAADAAATADHLAALRRDFAQLVQASEASNADDEHDPEGATIGFERAQLSALIDQAETRLADLERALQQVRDGGYGVCERCGAPIGAERLEARPAARTCIGCAS